MPEPAPATGTKWSRKAIASSGRSCPPSSSQEVSVSPSAPGSSFAQPSDAFNRPRRRGALATAAVRACRPPMRSSRPRALPLGGSIQSPAETAPFIDWRLRFGLRSRPRVRRFPRCALCFRSASSGCRGLRSVSGRECSAAGFQCSVFGFQCAVREAGALHARRDASHPRNQAVFPTDGAPSGPRKAAKLSREAVAAARRAKRRRTAHSNPKTEPRTRVRSSASRRRRAETRKRGVSGVWERPSGG